MWKKSEGSNEDEETNEALDENKIQIVIKRTKRTKEGTKDEEVKERKKEANIWNNGTEKKGKQLK